MVEGLDMSLDDIIKKNKTYSGGARGRRGGAGPSRRFSSRGGYRFAPYSTAKAPGTVWKHNMYSDRTDGCSATAARVSSKEAGTKLIVSNLDYGVSDVDVEDIFSSVGDLKHCSINYDRTGRSMGSAVVMFLRRRDALAAMTKFNNVSLDGKPMNIEIVGFDASKHAAVPQIANRDRRRYSGAIQSNGLRGGRKGRGYRQNDRRGSAISAEALDADLEKYHREASETN
ncbi:THO complex subunit 4A-like isoform X1 [Canna indica]|uniref:THO complex subunit 4A-like isoform X1 n=1 Tax=Canna indica TaxID=4628 RepID=A0AAQ3KWP6_9LILI|nr:THO complex subunit 4A-like isoform X1 [Canna indica]